MTCPLPHRNPAEPDPGYIICRRHLTRLTEHLTAIAVILDDLDELLITPPPMDANDVRSARCDPPAPCRLDILNLLDPRSDTPVLPILNDLSDLVAEQRHLSWRPTHHATWTAIVAARQARWLIRHVDWLAHHENVVNSVGEITQAFKWLNAAAGLKPPPALFRCPVIHPDTEEECGGPVRAELTTFGVKCAKCGERWSGDEQLHRLGLVEAS